MHVGNTSSASIPLALSRHDRARRARPPGDAVLLLGFGAGISYAAQVINGTLTGPRRRAWPGPAPLTTKSNGNNTKEKTHPMAMTEQEILTGLGEIIDEVAGVPADEVTPDKSFVDDLDIDSLSMVEIAVAAQDKFGVEIPDDELKNLKTVQDVIDYVRRADVSA